MIYDNIIYTLSEKENLYMKKHFISLFIIITVLFSLFSFTAGATKEDSRISQSMSAFLDIKGEIIGVSSKGEWDMYPENSVPAIKEAAKTDIDFIAVDVKRAYCGTLILFSDDTTERMLDSDEPLSVADTDYSVLSAYRLKNACGGSNAAVTEYSVPTLSEAIDTARECDIPLILRCNALILTEVTRLLIEKEALSMCIILTDAKPSEIEEAVRNEDEKPYIVGSKKGNVVFDIYSYMNALTELNASGLELKTSNRYGINYYKSLLAVYSKGLRIIADPTVPETCGARQDSEKWWDDLISRGYTVILTDHAELFSDYKKRNSEARIRLEDLYDKCVTNHTLPDFRDEALNDLKKAYTDAVSFTEGLLNDNSSALVELNDAYSALSKTANDISKNFSALEDGSAGTSITVPRIILCVSAVIAVVTVQIYFFKKRRKD